MSSLACVDAAQITAIAREVFADMIDGQAGLITSWAREPAVVADPVYAWLDLGTEPASRVQLTTDATTADDLTRALLRLEATDPVAEADVVDALGEIANICSGNIKALLPEHVEITFPAVSRQSPSGTGAVQLNEVPLAWRGRPLVISLWTI